MGPQCVGMVEKETRFVIELTVYSVLVSLLTRHRVVLLKEKEGDRYLPVWIGSNEADAIAMRLQGTRVSRPLTHDLLVNVIDELDADIQHIVVSELKNNTFYARIAIVSNGHEYSIDSRTSDAIAVAVRAQVPIYADESVMEQGGILPSPDIRASVEDDESLDVFRDFVDSLDLDDLGE